MNVFKSPLFILPIARYEFSLNLAWLIPVLILVPILIRLGVWQLDRANERQTARDELVSVMQQKPLPINEFDLTPSHEKLAHLTVSGVFDWSKQFLLENQVHNTVTGFEVLAPLTYSSGRAILVSRGWIPASPGKKPDVSVTAGIARAQSVAGLAVIPESRLSDYQRDILRKSSDYKPSNTEPNNAKWPVIITEEDFATMSSLLELELVPRILQPQQDLSYAYRRVWQPSLRGPAVNYGYAAQWFGMAILLIGVMLWANTKRAR